MDLAKKLRPDLFILDGLYTIHRAYHASPKLTSPNGFPTGAIHGFLGSILSAIAEMHPRHIVVAQEGAHLAPAARESLFPDYKATRPELDAALSAQIPIIFNLCNALGWRTVAAPGYEADDVIASYLHQHPELATVVFTTDKDILSCISKNSWVYTKIKGKGRLVGAEDIVESWGIQPRQIPEVLALCGDDSDNIPGVDGIGRDRAVKLIRQYGTAANVLANLDKLELRVKRAIESQLDKVALSQQLLAMKTDLALPALEAAPVDRDRVRQTLGELGLKSVADRFEKVWVDSDAARAA